MTTETKLSGSEEQAIAQLESIKGMVAALECDYDQLADLRDDREQFSFDADCNAAPDGPGYLNDREAWEGEYPEAAEELKQLEEAAGECKDRDEAAQRISEDALEVQVRSDWHSPGEPGELKDFYILLCTGGPAVRIRGELDEHDEPYRAWLEHQDWGTPWTMHYTTGSDNEALLKYAGQFLFAS